jgi:hypothetical protein
VGGPSKDDIAKAKALGLTETDIAPAPVEVWPDCWQAVQVWFAVQTQWRMGPAGPVGLDYNVLPWAMRLCGVKKTDRADVFEDVRVMERAALDEMAGQ